jgi:hypothetical protein
MGNSRRTFACVCRQGACISIEGNHRRAVKIVTDAGRGEWCGGDGFPVPQYVRFRSGSYELVFHTPAPTAKRFAVRELEKGGGLQNLRPQPSRDGFAFALRSS